jgi:RING finger protein 113A
MKGPQDATDTPAVTFKKRNTKTKSNIRKREPTPPPASDSDSGFTLSEDEEGRQIKRRRKNAGLTTTSSSSKPMPTPEISATSSTVAITSTKDDATKSSTYYEEHAPSATTSSKTGGAYALPTESKFLPTNPNRAPIGPVKQSTNVRTITTTDFAPDVCKDYKQTGFCGFGDSCKFLHAREDYKQGWQLDRDWEINTRGKSQAGKTFSSANKKLNGTETAEEEDEKLLESIPFKCIICKDDYKNPIVTRCNHYFCEACALKRYRKDPSCAACAASTNGVFNVAKKLKRLLERKREREERIAADKEVKEE